MASANAEIGSRRLVVVKSPRTSQDLVGLGCAMISVPLYRNTILPSSLTNGGVPSDQRVARVDDLSEFSIEGPASSPNRDARAADPQGDRFGTRLCRQALFHRAEIVIEPVEGVFHIWQDCRHVPGVVQNVFFVDGWCAEGAEHRFLGASKGSDLLHLRSR